MDVKKRQSLIKKLLYQSCNRGCKETDFILGNFARKHIEYMEDEELLEFEKILNLPDLDIYDWYSNKKPIPENYISSVMRKILDFNPR